MMGTNLIPPIPIQIDRMRINSGKNSYVTDRKSIICSLSHLKFSSEGYDSYL